MSEPIDIRGWTPLRVEHFKIRPKEYAPDLKEILISEYMIKNRVAELAKEIKETYYGSDFLAVCILEGARTFFDDLFNAAPGFPNAEKVGWPISSYDGAKSTKKVRFGKEINFEKVRGRRVLLIEDIIDSGRTLSEITQEIRFYNPASVEIACLLDKEDCRKTNLDIEVKYLGFKIPDKFVVGYGLDFNGFYRGLNHIGVLTERAIKEKANKSLGHRNP